ncbi:MAG: putative DNA-binding domain-containing protein [Sphingomonadales bacterium]|nr:putative DNA-binding domain-containing protein [Sphingomonadales bacterium]
MSLLESQIAFRSEITAADEDGGPSSPGMQVYRDAYRGRLLAALEVSFERTRRWVGDDAFAAAACHFVLSHPPRGWTLDDYGAEFPEVLAALFSEDAEVAELAWFEWRMQQAFAARDKARLDPAELAAAGYGEADWERMRFTMAPGFALRQVSTDCVALWASLAKDAAEPIHADPLADGWLVVWRSGLLPHYRLIAADEAQAITLLAGGVTFGRLAQHSDVSQLGTWLAQWLRDGVFSAAATEPWRSSWAKSVSNNKD